MRLGILTNGGDCPGLNAAIRAVVRRSLEGGHTVTGIRNGWVGAMSGDLFPLERKTVSGILPVSGTILGTSRKSPRDVQGGYESVIRNLQAASVEALIVLGGDGTMGATLEIHKRGFPVIGIPKTIDNDVNGTEDCIGFDTAATEVMQSLDRLHTSVVSEHRVMVVQTMGRNSGWLALKGGMAGGADFILIPEYRFTLDDVIRHLKKRRDEGRNFSIIVAAEGVTLENLKTDKGEFERRPGIGEMLALEIGSRTGLETQVTVLGHLQRGGSPTLFDRVLATGFGVEAVKEAAGGNMGIMLATRGGRVVTVGLETAAQPGPRHVGPELWRQAQIFY